MSSTTETRSRPRGRKAIGVALLAFGGIMILGFLVFRTDPAAIGRDVGRLGWGLAAIIALHIAVIVCDGYAWRALIPTKQRLSDVAFAWARWIREATNLLLPVAQIGGEIAGARILTLESMSFRLAGASVILDKIIEAFSQLPFTLAGLALLLAIRGDAFAAETFAGGLAAILIGAAGLVVGQRAGFFRFVERAMTGLAERSGSRLLAGVSELGTAMRDLCRADRLAASGGFHLIAWGMGAVEVWLTFMLMGRPIDFADAYVMESLGQMIASIGFIVPAGLGVQEGGYVGIAVLLGIPADAALALSLIKRARQIILGLPALAVWQIAEIKTLGSSVGQKLGTKPQPPSSDSNSYVRRALRALVRPLAGSGLTPNHITALRWATGIGACMVAAVGGLGTELWAGVLWIVTNLLDRADGEFARLTRQCSAFGHRFDYLGDVVINGVIFLGMGIGLRHGPIGMWSISLGSFAAASVATASILADELELRIGEKAVPSRSGFDSDNIIFILTPLIWLHLELPTLVGAAIGAPLAGILLWRRLYQLSMGHTYIYAGK
jgi:putative membrane protein